MTTENWILENDLCRCCHSEGRFHNLSEPCKIVGLSEDFSDMLESCFDIYLSPVAGVLSSMTYTICQACTVRLRNALDFKNQVLACEERFRNMYSRGVIKVVDPMLQVEVKDELPANQDSDNDSKEDWDPDYVNFIKSQDSKNVEEVNDPKDEEFQDADIKEELLEDSDKDDDCIKVEDDGDGDRSPQHSKNDKKETQTVARSMLRNLLLVVDKPEEEKKKTPITNTAKKSCKKPLAPPQEMDISKWKKTGQIVAPRFFLREKDYKKEGDIFQCARCDKKYDKKNTLSGHVKTVHYNIQRNYSCSLCTETYRGLGPLTQHKLDVHNIDERHYCKACNKKFKTKRQLNAHINSFHMLGNKFKCNFCDYESYNSKNLYKHKSKHKTVKDFNCRFCKKAFIRKATKDLHERIHTGERRSVCDVCGQAFVQKASLNYHMTKYHPEVPF